jgi:hypothetical protein
MNMVFFRRKTAGWVLFGVLAWTAVNALSCGQQDEQPGQSGTLEVMTSPSHHHLGKVVGIGPSALKITAPGTAIIDAKEIAGLASLLDGTNVDAVIAALEKAAVQHVFVDPAIVSRNPIPKNSVKHRLALAHPAGRLSAVSLSTTLFHYTLSDPPPALTRKAKEMLTGLARSAFGGKEAMVPDDAPPIVTEQKKHNVILTVRPMQSRHVSYHTVTANSLVEAVRQAGAKARRYYNDHYKLRIAHGPIEEALAEKLTIELEVTYDRGLFQGPRDDLFIWRIIEPGIYGIRMRIGDKTYYQPPWYPVTSNYRTLAYAFGRLAKAANQEETYWKKGDVPFERFRTVHWRERTPGGAIEDLYRASPAIPTMKDVTRDNLEKTLGEFGNWVANNQTYPSGRYIYRYFPTRDKENEEYNMVRHCVGVFSLALAQQYAPNPKYKEKAEAGMKFIEDHIRWGGAPRNDDGTIDSSQSTWMGKPLPGKDVAIIEFQDPVTGKWSSKMGTIAVAILGYTEYKRAGWQLSPEREKVVDGLARFLLYMHSQKDGHFYHYYVGTKSGLYNIRNSIYPGEILYAVARLYGETGDARYRVVFNQSLDKNLKWFRDQMSKRLPDGTYEERHRKNLVQFQPWMAMAMDEMYRYDQNPDYARASNLVSLWILDTYQFDETRAFYPDYLGGYMKVLDELPAMHTFVYTEGTAASFDLAKRAGADKETIDKLRRGAMLSARFIMQQQTRPGENDYYYPNPQKARGGARYCMNHNKQRIDYTYHALSSIYRILRTASAEDYAVAQAIEMPTTW